jgi:arabinan endo-1,5-alpha-L-arabinosidase
MKAGNEYRLYYSLASDAFRVSCIGLATASLPTGPWTEKGLAVTSTDGYPGTNAIDPTVVTTPSGEMWMVYGSAWDGLFELKLDASTWPCCSKQRQRKKNCKKRHHRRNI